MGTKRTKPDPSILDALDDPALFASAFPRETWRPWRAFLADERVRLYDHASNATRTDESLSRLGVLDGASGVGQRAAKQYYLNADKPQATPNELRESVSAPVAAGRG